tara:strand:- start:1987 stop:2145 length:159 start_codon:yes stop_codon:yes gene_type:complete
MIEFENYYRILEEKLKQKDYSQDPNIEVKKERKKPKLRQNQIFYMTKNYKKS